MILSDEPGYYEAGKFGIKIESLLKIVKAEPKYNSSGKNNKNNINFNLNDNLDVKVLQVLMIFNIIFDGASAPYFNGIMVDCFFVCLTELILCYFVCFFLSFFVSLFLFICLFVYLLNNFL